MIVLTRRRFLGAFGAGAGAGGDLGRGLPAHAGGRLRGAAAAEPALPALAVHARRRLGRSVRRRRRALDAAGPRAARAGRRHAARGGRGQLGGRRRRAIRARGRARHRRRRPRSRATRSTSRSTGCGRTAGTGTASAPATPAEPGRPHPHGAAGATPTPDQLRFAFASCQHYEQGCSPPTSTWPQDDLDLVFHLGDYIYEYAPPAEPRSARIAGAEIDDARRLPRTATPSTGPTRLCRRCTPRCPWFVTWDDHEVDNNYANDALARRRGRPGRAVPARGGPPPTRRTTSTCRCGAVAARAARDMQLYRKASLRPAGRVPRARHAPVPHRPAERRRRRPALRRRALAPAEHAARRAAAALAARRGLRSLAGHAGTCWRSR